MPDYLSRNSVEVDLAGVERWMKNQIEVQREDQPRMLVGYKKLQLVWFSHVIQLWMPSLQQEDWDGNIA